MFLCLKNVICEIFVSYCDEEFLVYTEIIV